MKRIALVMGSLLLLMPALGMTAQSRLPVVEVYTEPTCGCCSKWIDHLRSHGFTARAIDTAKIDEIKTTRGVPRQARSCHTAVVGGYVVEGHVPAADIQRLLKERPAIAGIAVPGMPIGSPGMEVPGTKAQPFDVIAFGRTDRRASSHRTDPEIARSEASASTSVLCSRMGGSGLTVRLRLTDHVAK